MDLSMLGQSSRQFIDTYCDLRDVQRDFRGELGRLTPCFIDVVLLGIAHAVSVVLYCVRLGVLSRSRLQKYRLLGRARNVHALAAALAFLSFLIVLFQLNGRIAAKAFDFVSGKLAPFELTGYPLQLLSWLLLGAILVVETRRYTPHRTWLWRFPVVFILAAQLAKTRYVVQLTAEHDYFFYLYLAYVGCQVILAGLALFHYPGEQHLQLLDLPDQTEYSVLASHDEPIDDKVCPEAKASLFSAITFSWLTPILRKGYRKPLQTEDMWDLPPGDKAKKLTSDFDKNWQEELKRPKPSLTRASWRTFKWLFLGALPFKLGNDASQFVGPVFLNLLLGVVENGGSAIAGYSYATMMLTLLLAGTLSDNQHFQLVMRAGFRLRSSLTHQVHNQVLSLSPQGRAMHSSGRIFNMVTSDVEMLQMLCQSIMGLISSPLRITIAMLLLYLQLGPAALIALGVLTLMMPMQAVIVRVSAKLLKKALRFTDERAKLESELLSGIDVVKCAAWEESFWDRIQEEREHELGTLWKSFVVAALNSFLLNSIPVIVAVATFGTYVLLGNNITASQAFTALSLLNVLRLPLFQLPQLITQLVNAQVSIKRIEEFLAAPKSDPLEQLPAAAAGDEAMRVQGEFTWSEESPAALMDIDVSVPAGSFVAIVGSTGCGKSSLLSAALGQMQQVDGETPQIHGKIAYVPQAPFIFGATVRGNVTFGLPFDEARYEDAINSASLRPDLEILTGGDQTELGERGVNISGGQKQRVSMARAIYTDADVYLLDDPLSALDAKVGREVFNECLMGRLADKTRVLVTNQLQYVSHADKIYYMEEGHITESGSFKQLMDQGGSFASLLKQAEVNQEETDEHHEDGKLKDNEAPGKGPEAKQAESKPDRKKEGGDLTHAETRATGRLSFKVINRYVQATGGLAAFGGLITLFVLQEAARIAATVWLSVWTSSNDATGGRPPHTALWYMAIYAIISAGQIGITLIGSFMLKALSLVAARSLHNAMLHALILAPMSFFHTTPLGRIINRLTKDTSDVDRNIADFTAFWFRSFLGLMSTVGLVAIVTPLALPALIPILLCFYFLYAYFQASVREVKRLDSISRSPVYTSIGEAINGVATLRAFRAEQRSADRNASLLDTNIVMSLANMSMNRWLSIRLETLGTLAAYATALLAIEQRGNAGQLGLVLSYALQITGATSICVRLASITENSFNAVERVGEYSELPSEPRGPPDVEPPDEWPQHGEVSFQDVNMRYRPGLPLVLKGLSITIKPGTNCGIVGRTGAGKSSLIGTIFRLTDLDSGRIVIDGIDISKLHLTRLRSAMAIIPQVPVLFTGTIRSNLAPFGEASDAEIWAALRRAHLAPVVEGSSMGLDMMLSEGGAPLSAGQKQLVALARADLRRAKILVLDEATAQVDVETDALIQKTIRSEFKDCTLIAIAHRLHTVIDGDTILVMDKGQAAEYGRPRDLLADPNSALSSLVNETGEATASFLRNAAQGKDDRKGRHSLDAVAARGLERVRSLSVSFKEQTARDVSHELLDKARGASKALEACLATLSDGVDNDAVREALGMDATTIMNDHRMDDDAAASSALQKAFKLVVDIAKLAEKANERMGVPKPLEKQPSRALRSSLSQRRMSRGSSISFPSPASSRRESGTLDPLIEGQERPPRHSAAAPPGTGRYPVAMEPSPFAGVEAMRIESPRRSRAGSRSPGRSRSPQPSSNGTFIEHTEGPPRIARMMSAPANAPTRSNSINAPRSPDLLAPRAAPLAGTSSTRMPRSGRPHSKARQARSKTRTAAVINDTYQRFAREDPAIHAHEPGIH